MNGTEKREYLLKMGIALPKGCCFERRPKGSESGKPYSSFFIYCKARRMELQGTDEIRNTARHMT